MTLRSAKTEDKMNELEKLNSKELLERIQSFPDQILLNTDKDGYPRSFPVGRAAANEQERLNQGQELSEKEQRRFIQAFSNSVTLGAGLSERPNMPENVKGLDLWDFNQGGVKGKKIEFSLVKEESGKFAVYAPTEDLKTVKVGYLDEKFAEKHPIKENEIVYGQYYRGQVELVFDAEKLYEEAELVPELTDKGEHTYAVKFSIGNFGYEPEGREKRYEDVMNSFPMKEVLESKIGKGSPITDVKWNIPIEDNRYGTLEITTNQALDGSQIVSINQCLEYLTWEAGWDQNENNHMFGETMEHDYDFLQEVFDASQTKMTPPLDHLITLEGDLKEIKIEPEITIEQDFADAVAAIPVDNKSMEQ